MTTLTISQGANALLQGQIIAYPTEAVFGLGCCPLNEEALAALVALKARSPQKGMILIASAFEQLLPFIDVQNVSFDRQQEINKTWPGPFTWVYPASKQVSSFITGQFETVAVRVTAHPVAKALCEAFAGAIISTSANISDTPPLKEFDEVTSLFKNTITGVVEGKVGSQEKPTAIFDAITGKQYR